ncbi:helix-turn-helix domain-containing protein [Psychrobacter immobilis]|uniref:helix-turn-helix domain-containing protein n=1 Tax=Psychrobacter immobilis TaxID=498 RepID=UPI002234C7B0|nr:helix-turn-helix domain-containing protein [Psychrobacter immobilis]
MHTILSQVGIIDISQGAKQSGVPASTLRFYEKKYLIRSVGRHGIRRVFSKDILECMSLIALRRVAGFSLDEITGILGFGKTLDVDRDLLLNKASELDETIQKLSAMRVGLQHAATCTAPSHLECPRFRRLMNLAATGAIKGNTLHK